jgi:hypothetical protein
MDRQDIDALLIGALYGELTPADEARLAAHLESHPADKTALDDLKSAREQVKASRIFEMQTEPPQAISAVLLQEAARRAPKQAAAASADGRESWFQRFVRSFAAHPAMAAAAMLVLVVGVAGTLYMKNGRVGVEKTVDQTEDVAGATAPGPSPADQVAQEPAAGSAAYQVGLAEGQADRKAEVVGAQEAAAAPERAKVSQATTATPPITAKTDDTGASEPKPAAHAAAPSSKAKKGTGYLEVETPQKMPKELPDTAGADKDEAYNGIRGAGGEKQAGPDRFATPPGGAPSAGAATGAAQQALPPPPPPQAAPATPSADYAKNTSKTAAPSKAAPRKPAAPAQTVAKAPAPRTEDAPVEATRGDTDLIAWAKQQHAAAVAKVKAGQCSAAAQIAVVVRTKAYGYYQQNMANDRELKGCASYIADAVNREEERSSKPKAAKRATDEEPAATQSK